VTLPTWVRRFGDWCRTGNYYSVLYGALLMAVLMAVLAIADLSMGNPLGAAAFGLFSAILLALRWRTIKRAADRAQ
jgi:hypothetical protein